MKFTIGYGVSGNEFFDDTLLMGDGVMVNQLEIPCPKIAKGIQSGKGYSCSG